MIKPISMRAVCSPPTPAAIFPAHLNDAIIESALRLLRERKNRFWLKDLTNYHIVAESVRIFITIIYAWQSAIKSWFLTEDLMVCSWESQHFTTVRIFIVIFFYTWQRYRNSWYWQIWWFVTERVNPSHHCQNIYCNWVDFDGRFEQLPQFVPERVSPSHRCQNIYCNYLYLTEC